jgi:hypothetical protein
MTYCGDSAAYFTLFDGAPELADPDWGALPDKAAALADLIRLFELGPGQAAFAARSLWGAPVADTAVPLLRELLPRLSASPVNEQMAAGALSSLVDGPEPRIWVRSGNPILRAVAAEMMTCDEVDGDLRSLLSDADGHVREAALNRVVSIAPPPPDLREILVEAAGQPPTGWTCLWCRFVNGVVPTKSCEGCRVVGPDPARLASELLGQQASVAP